MKLALWVHGTAGNEEESCGEVEVFDVSGEKIRNEILQELVGDNHSLRHEWFGSLPTERALLVDCYEEQESLDGDGLWLTINSFKELD